MTQTRGSQSTASCYARHVPALRPICLALGFGRHLLLCVSGTLLPLATAQANPPAQALISRTLTDQTFSSTINIQSLGQNGPDANGQDDIPGPGEAGAQITLQFLQSETGAGNTITTYGDGIFASSIGGEGGVAYTNTGGLGLDGGPGAGGGIGGVITISSSGIFDIHASGDQAHGIQAISQGGLGSAGQDASHGGGSPGGSGGSGKGITITLDDGASITTTGQQSNAILAQSLGSNAGNSGWVSETTGAGGQYPTGAVGGYGGDVTVTLSSGTSLTTSGNNANGILAVSRGSTGGSGVSIDISFFGDATAGTGGAGGNSGTVAITSGGSITTNGNAAMGIMAQSSSGNGGQGGSASGSGGNTGGTAGNPGTVFDIDITNTGTIATNGTYSPGILAQSFSGSGGVGGSASGSLFYDQGGGGASSSSNGGKASITLGGTVTTQGDNSQAVIAQSIGGKGGMGGDAGGMIYTSSGDGGVGGDGGMAQVTVPASTALHLSTQGQSSHGIVAQSVGGGGGMGGAASADGANIASAIGGQAGAGGNGGNTEVNLTANATDSTPAILTSGPGAFGILSQSVGGGGGAGGGAYTVSAGLLADISFAVGGSGGDGGNGGSADATLNGIVVQTGSRAVQNTALAADAIGVAVQSIGGGGGQGGSGAAAAYAIALPTGDEDPAANVTFSGAFAVGGAGGKGGNGGSATSSILAGSAISTYGDGSLGVKVQSIGGGGGHGGDSSVLAATIGFGLKNHYPEGKPLNPQTNAVNIGIAVGGKGGSGGNGGAASLVSLGTANSNDPVTRVSTNGEEASAVLVQSIGGGGGNAGAGNAKVQSFATSQNLDLTMSVGALGGSGGSGGTAYALLDQTGQITTYGNGSKGLVVQSIGGGGGTGTGSSLDLTGLDAWVNALGSEDGDGGESPLQATLLHDRHILVGAQGGTGGYGGSATVQHNAASMIHTYGVDAAGIVVQSIGGGGGLGGSAAATTSSSVPSSAIQRAFSALDDDDPSISVSVNSSLRIGGGNGSSGSGGSVTVQSSGQITTAGDHSPGIMAQSIGAGGGRGAVAASGLEVNGQLSSSLQSIGASLLLGNDVSLGYTVDTTVQLSPDTPTLGDGGAVTVNLEGSTITTGQAASPGAPANNGFQSFGILAQSIGGGGGMAVDGTPGGQATASLGAISGQQIAPTGEPDASTRFGNGGTVTLASPNGAQVGTITTYGDAAHGMFLQSVGGGGGVFGAGASQMATGGGDGRTVTLGLGSGVTYASLGLPSGSMQGGDGGAVSADFGDNIVTLHTYGHGAIGLLAQSVGGGGGAVAVAPGVAATLNYIGSGATADGIPGDPLSYPNGTGGDGGIVTISMTNATNAITTSGVGAHGIMAQSVGGGGGLIGNYRAGTIPIVSGNLATTVSASGTGNGQDINVTASGTIQTTGAGAMGILAQSIGGGGGWLANEGNVFAGSTSFQSNTSTGTGGNVTINLQQATVTTLGENSVGVWAQSIGKDGGQLITVNVGSDTTGSSIHGGSGQGTTAEDGGAAIVLAYGLHNQVNISAQSSVQALSGVAIKSLSGTTNIVNHGSLSGSTVGTTTADAATATTASGASALPISLSNFGTFSSADLVQGHLVNQGHVFIGKTASSDSLRVEGDFTQGSQGVLHVSTDFAANTTDHLTVDGHARLDGTIRIEASTLMPNRQLHFLEASTLTPGASLMGESDLFTYRAHQTGDALAVSVDEANFDKTSAAYGVGSNLHAVGHHLQDVWDRGSNAAFGALFATLNRSAGQGSASYVDAINDLSPGILAAPAALKQASMISFSNSLMSCPAFDGSDTQMREHDCVWGRVSGDRLRLDGNLGTSALKSDGVMYQVGTQRRIAPNWLIGMAGAYEHTTTKSDDRRQRIKGDTGYLGVSLKYDHGPWTFSGALVGSYGSFDNTRNAPSMRAQASSTSHVASIGQRLRAAYTHVMPRAYVKPFIDLDVMHTRMPSFKEHGAGVLNLHVNGVSKWSAIVSPGIEVGGRIDLESGYTVRPYASVGVSVSSLREWSTGARFTSAPAGTAPFNSTLETGRVFGQVTGGMQVLSKDGMDIKLQYDGLLSDKVHRHAGSLKASWRF